MRRRDFLISGAAGLGSTALAACSTTTIAPTGLAGYPYPGNTGDALVQPFDAPMRPIKSSMDRVTRTIVGLRPFRKNGPRLEAVKVGSKDVVHNYGHGGGGVSLSWGVAELAVAKVKEFGRREIAVLGSGAVGLATALQLQRSGMDVTVYAKDFPPYTTSNVAGAMWHPVTLYERDLVTPETMEMLHLASKIALSRFIRYANDNRYGVYWIRQFQLSNNPIRTDEPYIGGDDLYPGLIRNGSNGPFGFAHYDAFYTIMIDSDIYMRALVNDYLGNGGKMVEQTFETEADLEALPQASVVNCMGLGSGKVFGDEMVTPIRGQLSFLLPQNDIDYGYAGGFGERGTLYSFPRRTGILLGGSGDKGDWDTAPRQSEVERMVEGHAWLASRLT